MTPESMDGTALAGLADCEDWRAKGKLGSTSSSPDRGAMSRHHRSVAVVICAGLVGLLLTGATGRASLPGATRQAGARYRVGVDLVRLSVTARDAKDAIIHDLRPEEFEVLEDGVEQQPTLFGHHEAPISVVVLFDASGSMAGDKLMHAKDAVINFVGALEREDETLVVAIPASCRDIVLDYAESSR